MFARTHGTGHRFRPLAVAIARTVVRRVSSSTARSPRWCLAGGPCSHRLLPRRVGRFCLAFDVLWDGLPPQGTGAAESGEAEGAEPEGCDEAMRMRAWYPAFVMAFVYAFAVQASQLQVYTPGHGVSAPKLIKSVAAVPTPSAVAAHAGGAVALDVVVLPSGKVGDVKVVNSAVVRQPDPRYALDQQAVKAVRQWVFTPGTRAGKPVAVRVRVEVKFDRGL